MNGMELSPSGQFATPVRLLAPLVTPFEGPYGPVSALAQIEVAGTTLLTYVILGTGPAQFFFYPTGHDYGTHFPGGIAVHPDRPAVAWPLPT